MNIKCGKEKCEQKIRVELEWIMVVFDLYIKKRRKYSRSQCSNIETFKHFDHPSAPEGLNVTGQIPEKLS